MYIQVVKIEPHNSKWKYQHPSVNSLGCGYGSQLTNVDNVNNGICDI